MIDMLIRLIANQNINLSRMLAGEFSPGDWLDAGDFSFFSLGVSPGRCRRVNR